MSLLTYTVGDATAVHGPSRAIIAHVCNDLGRWGKGFVLAVSARWPHAEAAYRAWHAGNEPGAFELGQVQFVPVAPTIQVANMIAQHGLRSRTNPRPINYDALAQCLDTLGQHAADCGALVRMPRIGCGLAGGNWDEVEPLIISKVCNRGVPVLVCDPSRPGSAAGPGP